MERETYLKEFQSGNDDYIDVYIKEVQKGLYLELAKKIKASHYLVN